MRYLTQLLQVGGSMMTFVLGNCQGESVGKLVSTLLVTALSPTNAAS